MNKDEENELVLKVRKRLAEISEEKNINFNNMPLKELDKWVDMILDES